MFFLNSSAVACFGARILACLECRQNGGETSEQRFAVNNPKRQGSKVKERYALYRTGMTVAEYVEACKNTRSPQYALNDTSTGTAVQGSLNS